MNLAPLFIILVFFTIFSLMATLMPLLDEKKELKKRVRSRMKSMGMGVTHETAPGLQQVLREKYLRKLKPWEQKLESLPVMEKVGLFIEQSGNDIRGYRLALLSLLLLMITFLLAGFFVQAFYLKLLIAFMGGLVPVGKIIYDRHRRLSRIEEQLPEAIDMMVNSLRVGHSFTESVRVVSEDMKPPIAREFEITFADISYSSDMRRALMGMLQRVPSNDMMLLVVSVLVQRDTGGNITEVMVHISKMLRERFKFERRIKTVSASGRLGGRILALLPLAMFGVLNFMSPDYIAYLTETATGRNMMTVSGILVILSLIWLHRIQKIKI